MPISKNTITNIRLLKNLLNARGLKPSNQGHMHTTTIYITQYRPVVSTTVGTTRVRLLHIELPSSSPLINAWFYIHMTSSSHADKISSNIHPTLIIPCPMANESNPQMLSNIHSHHYENKCLPTYPIFKRQNPQHSSHRSMRPPLNSAPLQSYTIHNLKKGKVVQSTEILPNNNI